MAFTLEKVMAKTIFRSRIYESLKYLRYTENNILQGVVSEQTKGKYPRLQQGRVKKINWHTKPRICNYLLKLSNKNRNA